MIQFKKSPNFSAAIASNPQFSQTQRAPFQNSPAASIARPQFGYEPTIFEYVRDWFSVVGATVSFDWLLSKFPNRGIQEAKAWLKKRAEKNTNQ